MLLGTVAAVTETCNPETQHITTTITGEYDLGGCIMRRKTLNIRSMALYIDVPAPTNPSGVPPDIVAAPAGATAPDGVVSHARVDNPARVAAPISSVVAHGTEWFVDTGIAENIRTTANAHQIHGR